MSVNHSCSIHMILPKKYHAVIHAIVRHSKLSTCALFQRTTHTLPMHLWVKHTGHLQNDTVLLYLSDVRGASVEPWVHIPSVGTSMMTPTCTLYHTVCCCCFQLHLMYRERHTHVSTTTISCWDLGFRSHWTPHRSVFAFAA